ncbi:four-carbon acid sugar kinase family protein [uncultured Aeromicrobium sp.]|uniref:four-carbon acid sugar kinase family protein n=1 Tax=uncultured Aeromicrobium sp. TaxID=337820 RepID=UPI0025F5C8AF|nr:four-carbon acid sugar kinase family protein [uncultured Aeromicrobium sp.]
MTRHNASSPVPVVVVADDLTGANATGARFARAGLRSATVTTAGTAVNLDDFDAVIVSTDSRHINPDEAASRVRAAIDSFDGAELIIKRIDTTLRGNVSAEAAAALQAARRRYPGQRVRGLVAPAYPTSGRVTVDGVQLLNGRPLEQTELRYDVHNPMTTSSVAQIVAAQEPLTSRGVTLGTVLGDDLVEHLLDGDEDLVICDALEDDHLQKIATAAAEATRRTGIRWVSIDPGPTGAFLARALGLGAQRSSGPPLLAVVGSVTELSIRQTDYLQRSELVRVIDVDAHRLTGEDEAGLQDRAAVTELGEQIADALTNERFPYQILVRSSPPDPARPLSAHGRETLPRLLADAVLYALDRADISGLYSSGGDITAGILEATKVEAFEVVGEVIPLAVYGRAIGGRLDGLPIVTKGGLIGTEVTAEACMNQIRALAEGRRSLSISSPTTPEETS